MLSSINDIKMFFSALRFLFNIIILITALRRLPELRGYKGRRYPGHLPPTKPTIQPRRLNLPPDWQWQNIGSRRTEFLDLGMPKGHSVHNNTDHFLCFRLEKLAIMGQKLISYHIESST